MNDVVVDDGKVVKVSYTLTVDGDIVDNTDEDKPFEFKVGSNQVIPGFEEALLGMQTGQKKAFQVSPDKGYGQEDPTGIQQIPKDKLPPDITPEVGMTLYAKRPDGQTITARITELNDDTVVVNLNHPLSGKALDFEVEVVEIQ